MVKPEDKTILVVDDEPDVVMYLRAILEDSGFRVMTAANGDEALERLQAQRPDFISLDLVMPKKSGIRFFHELRKNKEWAKIPVAIVTGHGRDDKVQKDLEDILSGRVISGPQIYLEKPVKPQDYANLIKRELGIEVQEAAAQPQESEALRSELRELVGTADPKALEEALRILRERK